MGFPPLPLGHPVNDCAMDAEEPSQQQDPFQELLLRFFFFSATLDARGR